jgi:hypothetical protein
LSNIFILHSLQPLISHDLRTTWGRTDVLEALYATPGSPAHAFKPPRGHCDQSPRQFPYPCGDGRAPGGVSSTADAESAPDAAVKIESVCRGIPSGRPPFRLLFGRDCT